MDRFSDLDRVAQSLLLKNGALGIKKFKMADS